MTEDIVLNDQELIAINGAIGATTVLDAIASAIENMTPTSFIPPHNYTAWTIGPNATGSYGFGGGSYGYY
jgi:hypothetical protein